MARRQKIPTPLLQRWRQFRYQVVPVVSFAVATILVVLIWQHQISASHVVGEVMTQEVLVNAGSEGKLVALPGAPLQINDEIQEGQVLAMMDESLLQADIGLLKASQEKLTADIAALRDELEKENDQFDLDDFDRKMRALIERHRGEDEVVQFLRDKQNMELNISRLLADRYRIILEQAQWNSRILERQQAISKANREISAYDIQITKLQGDKFLDKSVVTDLERERTVVEATRDADKEYVEEAKKQIDVLSKAIASFDKKIDEHRKALAALKGPGTLNPIEIPVAIRIDPEVRVTPINKEIEYQRQLIEKLNLQRKSLVIRAPFSGKIKQIHAVPGQAVTAGDPIVTIAASKSEFIVTYVRQNQRFHPHPNDDVEIRTRTSPILVRTAKIQDIGAQVEMVPAHQLRDPKSQEWGTPVRIAVPQDLAATLRPGELVDIRFPPKPAEALPANTLAPGTLVGSVLAPAGK